MISMIGNNPICLFFKTRHIIKFKVQCLKSHVPHVFQEQCVARHAFARITAASVVQDIEKLLHSDLAPAYIYEGAHYGTHHVSEKTVGGNLEIPGGRGGLTHRAADTWQMVVLLSPPALQKAA